MTATMKRITLWGLTVAWCAVIFAFSSLPGSSIPGRYGNVAHFSEYAVLAVLVMLATRRQTTLRRALLVAVIFSSLYGVTDEFHQAFVPMRVPDPLDWLIDTAGAITGAGLAALAIAASERRRRQ